MWHLLQPAKVSLSYVRGQRKRYIHPLRLLVIIGAVFALLLISNRRKKNFDLAQYLRTMDQVEESIMPVVDSLEKAGAYIDTHLVDAIHGVIYHRDSVEVVPLANASSKAEVPQHPKIASRDLAELSHADLAVKYGYNGTLEKIELAAFKKMMANPDEVQDKILSNITWSYVLALPLLGLILLLLFRKNYPYLTQHLTFLAYLASFVVVLTSIGVLLSRWFQFPASLFVLMICTVYSLYSFRDFYQLRWWQSIVLTITMTIVSLGLTISLLLVISLGIAFFT